MIFLKLIKKIMDYECRPGNFDEFSRYLIRIFCHSRFINEDELSSEIRSKLVEINKNIPERNKESHIKREISRKNLYPLVFFGCDGFLGNESNIRDDFYQEIVDFLLQKLS